MAARLIAVVLTAYLNSGAIRGEPGNEIEVTDENRKDCLKLLKEKGAHGKYETAGGPPLGIRRKADEDDAEETDDEEGDGEETTLADFEDSDGVETLELSARHTKALQAAGIKTIADVRKCENLDAVPNLSVAVVARIKGVLSLGGV